MAGIYVPDPEIGFYSLLPDFSSGIFQSLVIMSGNLVNLYFSGVIFPEFHRRYLCYFYLLIMF